ncbi:MAG: RluA family pseudouridine synthase [Hyphomicrobiales bacterium]|nr:RluA family pseudouridine synthase [Hyphomicrobiales bacterium]
MNQHAKRRAQSGYRDEPAQPNPSETEQRPARQLVQPQAGHRALTVLDEEAGERLDKFLAARSAADSEALSRSRIQALIAAGEVRLDGAVASDAKIKVRAGQTVDLIVPEPVDTTPVGEPIALDVVFEDDHLIIIDKPAGLVVHPAAGHESGTLVNALIAHCGTSLSGIGGVRRPGIVHRLDKDTSGLLVVAKSDAAHQGLSELFADHGRTLHLVREYQALVWAPPGRPSGTVDAPVGRSPRNRERQAIVRGAQGREAITHWEVLERFKNAEGDIVAGRLACVLETGRTHQIRLHMEHAGHPVMGDKTYGTGFKTKERFLGDAARAALHALNRQALHASRLGFEHPVTGEELEFESPLPDDMQCLADALRV